MAVPPGPVAVSVYMVVAVGLTVLLPSAGRLLPPLIVTLEASVVAQVNVLDPPGVIEVGDAEKPSIAGGFVVTGFTVKVAERVTPPLLPEIVATVVVETEVVLSVKVRLVAFAGTVRLAGTGTAAASLDNVTTDPPLGATALKIRESE